MGVIFAEDEVVIENYLKERQKDLVVLYFYLEDSAECNQMTDVIIEVDKSRDHSGVIFIKVDATKEQLSKKYNVENAPTFLFYLKGNLIDKLVGANVPMFSKKLEEHLKNQDDKSLSDKLESLIKRAPVMLFMKGNPNTPRCGFSKQVIALLDSHNAKYETFDILEDFDVREGLKKYSNWPTYPQLYINGDLIGGLDILKELSSNGELDDILKAD